MTAAAPVIAGATLARGVHQSDVVIRAAVVAGILDLRRNPWLLDYAFAPLVQDALTAGLYGVKERDRAKAWFLKTDIPVVMDYTLTDLEGDLVTVTLVESVEAENDLADVDPDVEEAVEAAWPPLTAFFTPASYDVATGTVGLPGGVAAAVAPGMALVDSAGQAHAVTAVLDAATFTIPPGAVADLTTCYLRWAGPRLLAGVESLEFKETYRIGAHAHGDPAKLQWLYTILVFVLLRYKQALLEGRGFGRSTLAAAAFARNEAYGSGENVFSRYLTTTGYVRQYWPKAVEDRLGGVELGPVAYSAAVLAADGLGLWLDED